MPCLKSGHFQTNIGTMILTREKEMTTTSPDRLDRIESLLSTLGEDMQTVKADISTVKEDISELKEQTTKTNEKVETYQKASQQVVNLAFGLIVTAALAIILPVVTNH
ncbi:hypothetical protein [Acaryochloris marina]|uniref:Uncharacterized protein n=1 Tax=Acaryochloris marina (strain MBIC 11017) TaxID=329726 RepID=A8ZLD2_ACAM1|nr:hypothetical protein [Acaryochloris marina]ABW31959.1 conserved hypothetical protein [Acaryochloris marina MBIC11017]BDM82889.1 hypothetical protein AM10699_57500 [Acaryochloris marina MBIC10699]